MRTPRRLTTCCAALALSACAAPPIVERAPAEIDPALLAPVPAPQLACPSLGCMAELMADMLEALDTANGRILAIAETIRRQGASD